MARSVRPYTIRLSHRGSYARTRARGALEFNITESIDGLTDVPISKIKRIKSSLIACIARGAEIIIPTGIDKIKVGDRVIVLATGSINSIKDILNR